MRPTAVPPAKASPTTALTKTADLNPDPHAVNHQAGIPPPFGKGHLINSVFSLSPQIVINEKWPWLKILSGGWNNNNRLEKRSGRQMEQQYQIPPKRNELDQRLMGATLTPAHAEASQDRR
jgi:hypothetical protein